MKEPICIVCKSTMVDKSPSKTKKFCSRKCLSTYTGGSGAYDSRLPSGTVGAIAELIVSTDLLQKGYETFRALSPSCSCDLLALLDGKIIRIEVRTGYKGFNGRISYPTTNFRADVMAVVLHSTKEIIYKPQLSGQVIPKSLVKEYL